LEKKFVTLLINISSTQTCENLFTATNYVKTNLVGTPTDEREQLVELPVRPTESADEK
jgi:hypothetical protein